MRESPDRTLLASLLRKHSVKACVASLGADTPVGARTLDAVPPAEVLGEGGIQNEIITGKPGGIVYAPVGNIIAFLEFEVERLSIVMRILEGKYFSRLLAVHLVSDVVFACCAPSIACISSPRQDHGTQSHKLYFAVRNMYG